MLSFSLSELTALMQKRNPKMTRNEIRRLLIDRIDFYENTLVIHIESYDL